MTTVAYLAVAPEGRTHKEVIVVSPRTRDGLRRLVDEVHATGARISAQMGHAGPVANGRSNGIHGLAASSMPSPLSMQMIRSASRTDIARITREYVTAARLLVEVGFDALELHMAHSYFISSFLAPGLNRRKDEFGGSLENRVRLARQVAQAVRDEVGDEVAVYAKASLSDGFKGGVTADLGLEYAQLLESDGNLDAFQMSGGSSLMNPMYLFRGGAPRDEFAANMPFVVKHGMKLAGAKFLKEYPFEEAYFLERAKRWRAELATPLMLLGGINELETMRQAMTDGFEFVAMGRALLREPDLINRYVAGEATEGICIHCNRCMPTIYVKGGTHCPEIAPA
ncbi:MAG: NADH:flavin oxidoreductase, partial [Nocardioides sp.]|uniref:NADH:flavin oxidoreductase n=1 Tax=Nocardioides sp. TaxID=35761 RepID=UPI003F0654F7